jgi:hypothetical protein
MRKFFSECALMHHLKNVAYGLADSYNQIIEIIILIRKTKSEIKDR